MKSERSFEETEENKFYNKCSINIEKIKFFSDKKKSLSERTSCFTYIDKGSKIIEINIVKCFNRDETIVFFFYYSS